MHLHNVGERKRQNNYNQPWITVILPVEVIHMNFLINWNVDATASFIERNTYTTNPSFFLDELPLLLLSADVDRGRLLEVNIYNLKYLIMIDWYNDPQILF